MRPNVSIAWFAPPCMHILSMHIHVRMAATMYAIWSLRELIHQSLDERTHVWDDRLHIEKT